MKNHAKSVFNCDTCPMSFSSVKELIEHYEEKHPESIEKVTIPI